MMRLSKAQLAVAGISGLVTLWVLNRVMDADTDSARAAIQRQWLVVGILLAGGYVILRSRRLDCEGLRERYSQEAVEARYRRLGIVAWAFLGFGVLLALRRIWL